MLNITTNQDFSIFLKTWTTANDCTLAFALTATTWMSQSEGSGAKIKSTSEQRVILTSDTELFLGKKNPEFILFQG